VRDPIEERSQSLGLDPVADEATITRRGAHGGEHEDVTADRRLSR